MSWVTNMMISVGYDDADNVRALSEWLKSNARNAPGQGCGFLRDLTGPDDQWGGSKPPECVVWAGALNHADLDAVRARVAATPWNTPKALQLLLMDQDETYFRLWMIRDNALRQYSPTLRFEKNDPIPR